MRKPRSGTVTFRPRARLLKLIGEELISDDVVAVAELVKNAHDADALTVTVSFRGVASAGGEIEIRDDGCGMTLDTVLGRWMQPAASTKGAADARTTPRGRRVLGEKGVGRFAADKLAGRLELVTRAPGSDEVRALVDWDSFADGDRMLEDVQARWEVRPPAAALPHGTVLRMTGLRSAWTERMFRRLSIRLGRLLSPFRDRDSFAIRIESDDFPEYSGELRSDILDRAPYRIDAAFDGEQTVTVTTPRMEGVRQRWNGHGELACGPVRVRLYAYDLEAEALARIGPRTEVRAWLREWAGVSIYRDGFRVWPYGEPHDDWLRLDQRRVNNPVEHLSNNQIVGFIDITRDGNPGLVDQTNREGLVNNRALEDLRRVVSLVLQIIEAERQSVRHPARGGEAVGGGTDASTVADELERLAGKAAPELAGEIRRLGERIERERAARERMLEACEGLASAGQMARLLLPALPQELAEVRGHVQAARRAAAGLNGHGGAIEQLAGAVESLAGRLEPFRYHGGEESDRRRAIDLASELEAFKRALEPSLRARGVALEVKPPEGEVLRTEMRPEHFQSLLHILAANSIDWLGRAGDRRIRITLTAGEDRCDLMFSDTGPGIPAGLAGQVFEPGFSTKEGGAGMGLALARRLVERHGGTIQVVIDGRRKGANVRVVLPRKRSRATFGR